jgi:hypothetical protein
MMIWGQALPPGGLPMRQALLLSLLLVGCPDPNAVPDAPVAGSRKAMITQVREDADFSSDPAPAEAGTDTQQSFAATSQQVQEQVAQGQGGHYQTYQSFDQALDCETRRDAVVAARPACAVEFVIEQCSKHWTDRQFRAGECPACALLESLQVALEDGGCRQPGIFPMLRQ